MKVETFLEVKPELYSSKPNLYIIIDRKNGLYTKKEATIICDFLRDNMYRMVSYEIKNVKRKD